MERVDDMLVRQESLKLAIPDKAMVVGVGGVGSWTALLLALAGVKELWLFDHDTVSSHNLNRLPVTQECVNELKSKAVAGMIKTLRPNCTVMAMYAFSEDVAHKLDLRKEGIKWCVCTTDSLASRQMVYHWCRRNLVKYIEASAEGEFGGCTGMPAEWATVDEANPGYASVPVWVGPCVAAAMAACNYVLHNVTPGDTNVRLGWEEGAFSAYVRKEEKEEDFPVKLDQEEEQLDFSEISDEDLVAELNKRGYSIEGEDLLNAEANADSVEPAAATAQPVSDEWSVGS